MVKEVLTALEGVGGELYNMNTTGGEIVSVTLPFANDLGNGRLKGSVNIRMADKVVERKFSLTLKKSGKVELRFLDKRKNLAA